MTVAELIAELQKYPKSSRLIMLSENDDDEWWTTDINSVEELSVADAHLFKADIALKGKP